MLSLCMRTLWMFSGSGQIPFVAGAPLAAEGDGVYAGTVKTGVRNCSNSYDCILIAPVNCAGAALFLINGIDRCLQDCAIQQVLDVL